LILIFLRTKSQELDAMPHVKLPPATRNWKEIPSAGSYRVVVGPLRL